jgi:hypothetical protein
MKKSELRHIIRESLKEIMREEEKTDTNITYTLISKEGEIIKPKVKNEIQKVTTELTNRYPELEAKLAKATPGKLESFHKLAIRAKHAYDEINNTTFGTKEKIAKMMKYNKLFIAIATFLGINDKFDLKAVDIILAPLETDAWWKRNIQNPIRKTTDWFKDKESVNTIVDKIYGDGEPFFTIALGLVGLQIFLKLVKTQKPSVPKPGLFKRMAKGAKNLFREEVETNEIENFMDSFIDGYTDDILKKLKTI